jgi:hypothetical protein
VAAIARTSALELVGHIFLSTGRHRSSQQWLPGPSLQCGLFLIVSQGAPYEI